MNDLEIPTLRWGIKASFLRYLQGLEDLKIGAAGGASVNDEADIFSFPGAQRTELESGGLCLKFAGEVRLQAHGGMLLVILMNPWLTFTKERVELSMVDLMAWPDTSRREVIAVSPAGVSNSPAQQEIELLLTERGAETFNNVYPAGTPMMPVVLDPR